MNMPIGVIDSGVGGASILKALIKEMPNEEYVFLADVKNAPYGDKSAKKIRELTVELVDFLVNKRGIKMLVVACNTISATSKKEILKRYPQLLTVFLEPPIKTAIDKNKKDILILATKQTLKNNKTIKKYMELSKERKIKKLFIKELAESIDNNIDNSALDKILKDSVKRYDYDAVVIGCTHYNFIKRNLKRVFPSAEIISCENGVSKQARRLLYSKFYEEKRNFKGYSNVEILLTEYNESVIKRLDGMFPGHISTKEY